MFPGSSAAALRTGNNALAKPYLPKMNRLLRGSAPPCSVPFEICITVGADALLHSPVTLTRLPIALRAQ
jgi:hypothetical protein